MKIRGNFCRHLLRLVLVMTIGAACSAPSYAVSIPFTLQQLTDFLNEYRTAPAGSRKALLWDDVQQSLADSDFLLTDTGLVFQSDQDAGSGDVFTCEQVKDSTEPGQYAGIGVVIPQTWETLYFNVPAVSPPVPMALIAPMSARWDPFPATGTLSGAAADISFSYSNGRLVFNAPLTAHVMSTPHGYFGWGWGAWQLIKHEYQPPKPPCPPGVSCPTPPPVPYWVPEWGCGDLGIEEGFDVEVSGNFSGVIEASMDVALEPITDVNGSTVDANGNPLGFEIVVGRTSTFTGQAVLDDSDIRLRTDYAIDTQFWHILAENEVEKIAKEKADIALAEAIEKKNEEFAARPPYRRSFPGMTPALLSQLSALINTPYLQDFVEQNAQQILFYLLVNDTEGLAALLASDVACLSVNTLRESGGMLPLPLYTNAGGTCVAADPEGADTGAYFADSGCLTSIDFRPTSLQSWCAEMNSKSLLGNAAVWTADANPPLPVSRSTKWSIAQGTQLPLASEPTLGNVTPFMKRVDYRDITWKSPAVNCQLEMRIYKKDVNATGLTPLMAIHGGSWVGRGGPFVAMEAQLSHYTEQGFVVFAPFYRLAGSLEANPECNGASWDDLTSDVTAALDWVIANGASFGAKPGKITLMGQSAGAHLAGYLVTHQPTKIERAALLYPPADVRDFLANAKTGGTYAAFTPSLQLLSDYYGQSVPALQLVDTSTASSPPLYVRDNSFRDLVASGNALAPVGTAAPFPPVFLIHGMADTLVPSNQSVILCNAYGGTAINDGGGTALRATYTCGLNGRLHLLQEGKHALDFCMTTRVNGMCGAGSSASREVVASSMRDARVWLKGTVSASTIMSILSVLLY